MARTTKGDLQSLLNVLNNRAGFPKGTPLWRRVGDRNVATVGMYDIDASYGGYRLERIVGDSGATTDVSGRMNAGEFARWLRGFIGGMEAREPRENPGGRLTLDKVRAELRPLGLVIAKHDGEYRVSFAVTPTHDRERAEASAYYTDDLSDAWATGLEMARTRRNPVRATKRSKRTARALVQHYGKARARKVAGGMIGSAETPAQREHFVRVRKSLNPIQRDVNYKRRFHIFIPRGHGGLEYGWDGVTPVTMRVTFAANAPKGSRYVYGLSSRMVNTPGFQQWYKTSNREISGTRNEIVAQLEAISAGTASNPKRRMPITPEDRGILRAMAKEHGARAVSRAALRANPLPMFPMYVRKNDGQAWALIGVFNKLENARTVGNLIRLRGYQVRVTDGKE